MRDPIGRGKRGPLGALAFVAMLAMLAAAAPAADAAFGITNVSAQPAKPAAGANSDFSVSFDVQDPGAQMKDLVDPPAPRPDRQPARPADVHRGRS